MTPALRFSHVLEDPTSYSRTEMIKPREIVIRGDSTTSLYICFAYKGVSAIHSIMFGLQNPAYFETKIAKFHWGRFSSKQRACKDIRHTPPPLSKQNRLGLFLLNCLRLGKRTRKAKRVANSSCSCVFSQSLGLSDLIWRMVPKGVINLKCILSDQWKWVIRGVPVSTASPLLHRFFWGWRVVKQISGNSPKIVETVSLLGFFTNLQCNGCSNQTTYISISNECTLW